LIFNREHCSPLEGQAFIHPKSNLTDYIFIFSLPLALADLVTSFVLEVLLFSTKASPLPKIVAYIIKKFCIFFCAPRVRVKGDYNKGTLSWR
jgi:hypothetical protein